MNAIAEALGRGLKVPVVSITPAEAKTHFGGLAMFIGQDLSASNAELDADRTRLLADLDGMDYTKA
jgi:hypothetical protein